MGVEKTVKKQGRGNRTTRRGDTITVHCTGYLDNGKKFWSTKDKGDTFSFQLGMGKVIRGWDEGCMDMKIDEEVRLVCTGDYAYGERGFPAWGIGPNATLTFEIEVVAIA